MRHAKLNNCDSTLRDVYFSVSRDGLPSLPFFLVERKLMHLIPALPSEKPDHVAELLKTKGYSFLNNLEESQGKTIERIVNKEDHVVFLFTDHSILYLYAEDKDGDDVDIQCGYLANNLYRLKRMGIITEQEEKELREKIQADNDRIYQNMKRKEYERLKQEFEQEKKQDN